MDPYGSITVTNTKQPETTSITVKKEWKDSNGNTITAPQTSVTFDLYQLVSGQTPADNMQPFLTGLTVWTNGSGYSSSGEYQIAYGDWQTTISNLPAEDSSGNAYTYYVVETAPATGYEITYSNGSISSGTGSEVTTDANGSLTITNKKQPEVTSISVNKVWLDSSKQAIDGNSESLPASITFYLTRTANGTTERVDSNGNIGDTAQLYTLTKENSWTMTIENLPLKDSSGNTYSYSASEVSVEGYTPAVTVNGTTITITNTQTPTPSGTSLTVNKVWKNADGSDLAVDNYSVTVQLAQVATTVTGGKTTEVPRGNTATSEWSDWQLSDADWQNPNLYLRISYNKILQGYAGWDYGEILYRDSNWNATKYNPEIYLKVASDSTGKFSDTVAISSLPHNSNNIFVNFWGSYNDGATVYATLESVELIETVITDGETTVNVDEAYSTQTLNSGNNWSYSWTNLSASEGNTTYTYYVKEVRVENGAGADITDKFSVSYDGASAENPIGVSGEITITNTLKTTYVLPETGGAGIGFYRIGGSLLMGVAAAGLIGNTKRKKRKEADKTS